MLKHIKNTSQIRYFLFYYEKLGWRIPLLLFMSAIVAFFDGLGLALFIPLFQVAESGDASASDMGNLDYLIRVFDYLGIDLTVGVILVFLLGMFAFKGIIGFINMYYFTRIRVKFMKELRIKLVQGLCNISYPGFVNIDLGRIQNVITAEIGKAGGALLGYLSTLQAAIMLVGYLALAFMANFKFALLITLAGLLSSFIYRYINRKVETSSLEQSYIGNGLQGKVLESVWNYKYLKATDLISKYRSMLIGLINEAEDLTMRMGKLNAISAALREPVSIAMVAGVIFVQVVLFDVSMFSIVLSLVFFYRSLTSLMSVQNSWQSFLVSSGGIKTVRELYEEFDRKVESTHHEDLEPLNTEIRFEDVYFSYGKNISPVLNGISLSIQKNQTIAFVGESGSGKTTIVNMMAGLLLPERGKLLIDGVPLTPARVRSFRRMVGYITQEPVVFNDTVFNNVTFGSEKSEENIKRFWEVMEKTALTATIKNMPEVEDSMLGDNGVLISGGQKQRISIARELFRDCSLLLMDEATSALDSENEGIIQANINALKGKYTIVIIAHRLSTVRNADVIYLLDKGQIAASGTFAELQEKSPRFRKMVELQEF
ncbi:ABC transporter ATP-binding protein [Natronoflexus pectinivorans]|uniref:Subfamily B ATP-binding cassette protein MsbA n=1 Tax=Natronoflexus pectinivorans TaxID=682526 RepID=A0A4V2RW48_9BACT|nr:ABC transporter ATP-binding protein [Natronoflexus pectinivorans]TCO06844.1 subfamily B ATP-binding cassette protein MsbA [Natronoflexus pectinivorans]